MATTKLLLVRGLTSCPSRNSLSDLAYISSPRDVSVSSMVRSSGISRISTITRRTGQGKFPDGPAGLSGPKLAAVDDTRARRGSTTETSEDDYRDDAGVIKDMELFLGDLSLEYDSVWDTKPAWCQPWSIVGTGAAVIAASWLVLHNIIVSGVATVLIGLWWFSFLYAYPLAYSEMIAERRRMIEFGDEDTYGRKRDP